MRRELALSAALLLGCDSVSGTGSVSCDELNAHPRICTDFIWTDPGWYGSFQCNTGVTGVLHGGSGAACTHDGAIAGCRDLSTAPYRTITTWYYEGSVEDVEATCLPPPTRAVILP